MRTFLLLLCLAACTANAPAFAGRNSQAMVLVHVEPYSNPLASCTALSAAVSGLSCSFDVCNASPTAGAGATDVLVALFAYQDPVNDPDPELPGDPGLHLTGAEFGLQYDPGAIDVEWTNCADLESVPIDVPMPLWPLPGSGRTVVWAEVRRGSTALIGFFRVTVHGAGTLSVIGNPAPLLGAGHGVWLQDDASALDLVSVGSEAGFGGASGCERCAVPVRATTWGRIKSQYD